MNFKFATKINSKLQKLDFKKAIAIAETELKKIPTTDFHAILGQSLTDQANDLAAWINDFYKAASKKLTIKALYFEMNEFDINTEVWFIDCFAFSKDGGLDLRNMGWICDYETDSRTETNTIFIIEGLKKLQNAFETVEPDNDNLQNARDWSEQLIIARFMELMRAAHLTAKENNFAWDTIPIYFTEHSYDFILKSKN